MFSLVSLIKKFFKFDNVINFHFTLMNITMLIREKYEQGGYHCYCHTYRKCCCNPLVRPFLKHRRPRLCALCKLQSFCYQKDAIDGMCVLEFLDRNSENSQKLNQLAKLFWPFFRKIFFVRKDRLEFFYQEYHWTHRDWNTFETSSLTFKETIDYNKHLIELNRPERYFTFTYGKH